MGSWWEISIMIMLLHTDLANLFTFPFRPPLSMFGLWAGLRGCQIIPFQIWYFIDSKSKTCDILNLGWVTIQDEGVKISKHPIECIFCHTYLCNVKEKFLFRKNVPQFYCKFLVAYSSKCIESHFLFPSFILFHGHD